jgi:hypothetical protein
VIEIEIIINNKIKKKIFLLNIVSVRTFHSVEPFKLVLKPGKVNIVNKHRKLTEEELDYSYTYL